MRKKWDRTQQVRYCVILALTVTVTNSLCHFGMGYIAGRKIQIFKELAAANPNLEQVEAQANSSLEDIQAQHWDDGESNAFISALLIYVLVVTRKNAAAESAEEATVVS